jgi:phosphate transport system substrate-binding protein
LAKRIAKESSDKKVYRRKNSRYDAAFLFLLVLLWPGSGEPVEIVKIGGDGSGLAAMRALEEPFMQQYPGVALQFIPGLNSGGARSALPLSVIDIAITSTSGDTVEKLPGAMRYGKSPFVFVTAPTTQAYNLASAELVDIYAGKKTTWGNGDRLRLILKPQSDSATQILKSISPGMAEAVLQAHRRPGMRMALSDGDVMDAVINTPGALATSTLAMVLAGNRSVNILSVDGRIASPRSIPDGTYPWFKTYYVAALSAASPTVRHFVEFVLSPAGRQRLSFLGHWTER